MIKKQHAIFLAIIGTAVTALFFVFFSHPEDPRGKGGNYPLDVITSPTPSPTSDVHYKNMILAGKFVQTHHKPTLVNKSSLQKDGEKYLYTFKKANTSGPSFSNFSVALPSHWDVYEILKDTSSPDTLPIPAKYVIALINQNTNEVITVSQIANHILGCEYTFGKDLFCSEDSFMDITTTMGTSYLVDFRMSGSSSFKVCVDITKNYSGAYNYDNNSLGLDCTYGTEVGLIDVYTHHMGSADELSPEVLEILASIELIK